MIVNTKEILAKAREERFGVGAFNVFNQIDIDIILNASEELNVPVILQTFDYGDPNAEGPAKMEKRDADNFLLYLKERAKRTKIPVAINLDHCSTYEGCIRAIQYGATSVMLDASMKSFEENVALTKKVVEAAHGCGVSVEAEIGHVGSNGNESDGDIYTTCEEAKKFYEATGVDMLAVSIGTAHGFYATKPTLQFDRIAELREAIPIPLVMHGGSGLDAEQYAKCVSNGIAKINFGTYLQLGAADAVKETIKKAGDEKVWFMGLVAEGKAAGIELIKKHIGYFGTKPIEL